MTASLGKEKDKRFWDMNEKAVGRFIEERGLDAWKRKVAEDRNHTGELATWPNPWLAGHEDVRRQNIVCSLAPDLAARLQLEAEEAGGTGEPRFQ